MQFSSSPGPSSHAHPRRTLLTDAVRPRAARSPVLDHLQIRGSGDSISRHRLRQNHASQSCLVWRAVQFGSPACTPLVLQFG